MKVFTILFLLYLWGTPTFVQNTDIANIDKSKSKHIKKASFKGDKSFLTFIYKETHYPKEALNQGIEGIVQVKFVVKKDGTIDKVETLGNKFGYGLEEEAIRVVKSSSGMWEPATLEKVPVNSYLTVGINFKIDSDEGDLFIGIIFCFFIFIQIISFFIAILYVIFYIKNR